MTVSSVLMMLSQENKTEKRIKEWVIDEEDELAEQARENFISKEEILKLKVQLMQCKDSFFRDREEFGKEYLVLADSFEAQRVELETCKKQLEMREINHDRLSQAMRMCEEEKETMRYQMEHKDQRIKFLHQKIRRLQAQCQSSAALPTAITSSQAGSVGHQKDDQESSFTLPKVPTPPKTEEEKKSPVLIRPTKLMRLNQKPRPSISQESRLTARSPSTRFQQQETRLTARSPPTRLPQQESRRTARSPPTKFPQQESRLAARSPPTTRFPQIPTTSNLTAIHADADILPNPPKTSVTDSPHRWRSHRNRALFTPFHDQDDERSSFRSPQ